MVSKNTRAPAVAILFFACATLTLLCSVPVTGQTVTGTLQGTVSDMNGAVIPNAEIIIHNVETGQERTLTTNSNGFYVASFLPPGRYNVTVSQKGFSKVAKENIEINLNQTRVIDITLNPTGVTESVVVTSEATPINTTNAEIKGTLNTQEILDKPTFNPGSFLTLAETFTGFQENPTSGQNNPTSSSGSSINFNGTGTRGATFQINGVNNDDSSENQNRQGAALSTIKEFQVITNNFSSEFGRGYGAVVLVQTKSGTNRLRGDAYLFHNDSFLNARSYFSPKTDANGVIIPKPVNRRNQYGFTAGFPIIKNHLFMFVSFYQKRESGALSYRRDILLPAERDGSLLFKKVPANDTPANRAFIKSIIDRFPADLVPNQPSTSNRTYVGQVGFDRPLDDYSGRLDWNPRESDNVSARWQYTRQIFDNQDIIVGEATKQNNKQQNLGMTWTHLFSARTVGEFRYGLGLRTTLVGIKAGDTTPIVRFPSTLVQSIIGNAGSFPINRYQTDNQFVYNISTLLRGNHFFKTGFDIRREKLDDLADSNSRGSWSFGITCAGTTFASSYEAFLNGCVSTFTKGYGPFFLENRINESNFYGEDNWKVRPNLTFNLGARYEYVGAPREIKKRIDYAFDADKNNIEPRFGFAYSPGWNSGLLARLTGGPGNSSIRGGYGIFHGRLFQSVFSQNGATVRFNPPNALTLTPTNSTNLADPTNGFVFIPGPQTTRHPETLVDPSLEMPYTQQWNLTFERQLPFSSAVRVSYTGNRGIGLLRYVQDNLPLSPLFGTVIVANHPNNAPAVLYAANLRGPGDPRGVDVRGMTLVVAKDALCAGTGLASIPITTQCPVAVPIGVNEISVRLPRTNERRPNGLFTTNLLVGNGAWSYYHGLQAEWEKNVSRGLQFKMAYTWSHAIDTNSEATFVGTGDSNFNGPNVKQGRANSRFDTRHRFTINGSYLLPFFHNKRNFLGEALGGWQISMVMKLASGTPFTVTGGATDLNFDGFAERAALVDPSVLGRGIDHPDTSRQLLPASAFRFPTPADLECCILGRNTFYTDGVKNFDLGIYKNFDLPFEGQKITLRMELYNAFNHVQFGFPVTDFTSSTFARITGTATQYNPRIIQFALRYTF